MLCIRECSQCGQLTEYKYDDNEWEERGQICEQCEEDNETDELLGLDII